MKTSSSSIVSMIIAAACMALPATGLSDHRDIKIRRDLDGDGHFNTKKIEVPHHYRGRSHYGSYGYRQPYYGSRYYGSRHYGSPYYGRGYGYYPRSSFGISVFSSPRVVSRERVYRGRVAGYAGSLAVDVQRELKRRGYYRGSLDGDIGPRSRSAIRAYQRDRGLSATGRIDQSLLRSLRIG